MSKEMERKVMVIRTKMWKEIDLILQKTEKELLQLEHEN